MKRKNIIAIIAAAVVIILAVVLISRNQYRWVLRQGTHWYKGSGYG